MKNYIKLIVFVLLMFFGNSCEEFELTSSVSSTITEENLLSNIDFADKAVIAIYSNFANFAMLTRNYQHFFSDTDIEICLADSYLDQTAHYYLLAENRLVDQVWTYFYQAIEAANILIDNLPKSALWNGPDQNKARRYYGEAITLRAFCYFHLMMWWGDLPFFTTATQGDSDFYPPKTDRDEIYEYLIKELKDIEDYMPWMGGSDDMLTTERVTKGFVKGLRAKMALCYSGYSLRNKTFETRRGRKWQEYIQIANQECKEIMESGIHNMNPSFENHFRWLHADKMDMTFKETIFDLGVTKNRGAGHFGLIIGMDFQNIYKYGINRHTSLIRTTPVYYYSFDKKDLRRDISCELYHYYNTNGKQTIQGNHCGNFALTKWRKNWCEPLFTGITGSNLGVNVPIMRYTEVVLMFAETENEINGPTAEAKEALASVRRRAFPSELWPEKVDHYVDSVSTSKENFFNAIVDERAWEFGGEMLRKWDLIRWNILGPKLREFKENMLHLINDDDPKYAHVPTYIFYKYQDDDETIEILNKDYRLPSTEIPGYTRATWISLMSTSNRNTWNNVYFVRFSRGYDETKNNHLFPISNIQITNSRGAWENDQIP